MKTLSYLFSILIITIVCAAADEIKQRIPPGPGQESVWDYPRPPKVEKTSKQIRVIYDGILIAETNRAVRVLETGHPPVYYIPRENVRMEYLYRSNQSSTCEFKGTAFYYNMKAKTKAHEKAAWSYPKPTTGYELIRDHIAFYPKLMDGCFVNG
jgi:uncharacterized protein (DUF427 family)